MTEKQANAVASTLGDLPSLERRYTDIHAHPELSMQEFRTSGLVAQRLGEAGYVVTTGIGKTGVVGLFRNGDGPTVMLRADMDALHGSRKRPACRTRVRSRRWTRTE